MARPATNPYRSSAGGSSTWIVFLVKVLFVLIILLLLPKLVYGRKKTSTRIIKSTRSHCREQICSFALPEESLNCVNFCVSPSCYETVYGQMPLEDGEIDLARGKVYDECLKNEQKRVHRRKRELVSNNNS